MKKVILISSMASALLNFVSASSTKIGFTVGEEAIEASKNASSSANFMPIVYVAIVLIAVFGFMAFKKRSNKKTKSTKKSKSKSTKKK